MRVFLGKIRSKISAWMEKVPLWAEFTLFMAIILILLTVVMSIRVYNRELKRTIDSQALAAQRLVNLKMSNLEEYIKALSDFAILPVYDSNLYSAIISTGDLTEGTVENIRQTVRTYYYTRSDLKSYHIYLLNHDIAVGRDYGKEGIRVYTAEDMETSELYSSCADSRKNYAVLPSEHEDSLFSFVHSIIKVRDKSIAALTEFEVDYSSIAYLSSQSISPEEVLSLYNCDGELLYTDSSGSLKDCLSGFSPSYNMKEFLKDPTEGKTVYKEVDGVRYILVTARDKDDSLILTSLVPLSDILSQIRQSRIYAALVGLVFLLIAVIGAYLLIRYLSAPLSELVKLQENFGEGQIIDTHLGRSRESAELSRSFNQMTRRIDTLIKENYAAELNEKNARLAALEAQVNPHFLYNTLQAIGSEALLNDQTEIYRMLTSLASNLRYSIKAPNVVTLGDELKYMNDYILLQKIRMEDRLGIELQIDMAALEYKIPKMSIQALIENSILHGIGGGKDSINISLRAEVDQQKLVIKVRDDGIGIEEGELEKIRESFHSQTLNDANQGIGLANLYNRLLLLYGSRMEMALNSEVGEGSYTEVVLILPGDKIRNEHDHEREKDV